MLSAYEAIPARMQNESVARYHAHLAQKRAGLAAKRCLDILASLVLIGVLSPVMLVLAALIKLDSRGPVFYRQQRYTSNLRTFQILKFRSMVTNADVKGPLVTVSDDKRITRVGAFLRRSRLDELPQLFNILVGQMSFVGTRPEVGKYVSRYTDEMLATLLLPAGLTSEASMAFRDEAELLHSAEDADEVYVHGILPQKMAYNLKYLENFSFWGDIKIMFATLFPSRNKK